ncbi:MAG TPA: T9SS type A sorting domain-containing protein, partial [Bacteroidia bacterium]|nr:T9SS type A sorting domain-containing protein [Bacteroidia bacterium]
HSMYISSLCWMMQDFNNAYLDPIIDSLANRIRTDVYADSLKFYTNQQFEDDMTMDVQVPGGPGGGWIPGLKNFIAARNASMTSQLAPFGCYLSVNEIVPSPSLSLFPNPGNDLVTVTLPSGWTTSNSTLHVFDFSGREILNDDRRDGKTSFGMDVSSFADGLYLVEIRREDGTSLSSRMIVSH